MPRAGSNYISLSFEDRINIVQELLLVYNDNKLPRGKLVEVANNFRVHASTISRIWQRALQARQNDTNNSPGALGKMIRHVILD